MQDRHSLRLLNPHIHLLFVGVGGGFLFVAQPPQPKSTAKSDFLPTDGTGLPIDGSGDFGASPFFGQLSIARQYARRRKTTRYLSILLERVVDPHQCGNGSYCGSGHCQLLCSVLGKLSASIGVDAAKFLVRCLQRRMSQLGQTETSARRRGMSVLPSGADMAVLRKCLGIP